MDICSQSSSLHEFMNRITNIKGMRLGIGFCISLLTLFITLPAIGSEGRFIRAAQPVAGQYLVVLKDVSRSNVPDVANQIAQSHNGRVRKIINNTASIFSVELTEQEALRLSRHPLVLSVEEVGYIHLSGGINLPAGAGTTSSSGPLWNLDRIDQTNPTPNLRYNYCERGAGVIAYVVDTGILRTHSEFQRADGTSRVKQGVCKSMDCQGFEPGDPCATELTSYVTGHGTAVASVLGGKNIGAAPNVSLVPVRVTSCTANGLSTTENICWGLDWIRGSENPDRDHRPALINMSIYANAIKDVSDARAGRGVLRFFAHSSGMILLNATVSDWRMGGSRGMKEISEGEFDSATANGVVLVDFGAEWCAPCKAMLPVLQKVSSDYAGRLDVYSVDIDKSPGLAAKVGVMSVPTLLVFQSGRQVDRIVGALSESNLKKKLDPYIGAA